MNFHEIFYQPPTQIRFRADLNSLVERLRLALPPGSDLVVRKKIGLIAWKDHHGQVRFFWFTDYNAITYRLSTKIVVYEHNLPKRFRSGMNWPSHPDQLWHYPHCRCELSFHYTEADQISALELIAFLNSAFSRGDGPVEGQAQRASFYQWLLFAHDPSYPGYAWSRLGQSEQNKLNRLLDPRIGQIPQHASKEGGEDT